MLRIQFAGLSLRVHRRLQKELKAWSEGLEDRALCRFAPTDDFKGFAIGPGLIKQIEANIQDGFTHVALPPARNFQAVAEVFRFDCRTIKLAVPDGREVDWDALQGALDSVVDYEERWCKVARPRDVNHPLLLPPALFEPHSSVNSFWNKCDCYGSHEHLTVANNALQTVHSHHRKKCDGNPSPMWCDMRGKRFAVDKARHAFSVAERQGRKRFRFCWEVPGGFHYDVTHESGGEFDIENSVGVRLRVRHANIDSWGAVRA